MRRTALLIILLLLAPGACRNDRGPDATPVVPDGNGETSGEKHPHGGPVLAIGDSILLGATEHGELANQLALDGWELESIAEEGRSTSWAAGVIEQRTSVPRYVVVVLGSNPGHSSVGFADDVMALRNALVDRGARRIVWIPPHNTDPERYAEKDRILREDDAADGRLYVPDWGSVLDASPEYVGGDGLHLTENGYHALSDYIRDALAREQIGRAHV